MPAKITVRRAAGLAAVGLAAVPVLAAGPAWAADDPPVETCETIAFDSARLVPRPWYSPIPRYQLVVTGTAAYADLTVKLVPLVYVQRPEFWGYEVQGCRRGDVGLPAERPFTLRRDVTAGDGSLGVEVIGADKTVRLPFPRTFPRR